MCSAPDSGLNTQMRSRALSADRASNTPRLLRIRLPKDNIFGLRGADRKGRSVAHSWVVLLKRLAPATHTIQIDIAENTITTTIIVT
jgi:hypothetical protein